MATAADVEVAGVALEVAQEVEVASLAPRGDGGSGGVLLGEASSGDAAANCSICSALLGLSSSEQLPPAPELLIGCCKLLRSRGTARFNPMAPGEAKPGDTSEKERLLGMVSEIVVGEDGEGELLRLLTGLEPGVLSRECRKLELRVRQGSGSRVGMPVAEVVVVHVEVDMRRIRLGGKLRRNLCKRKRRNWSTKWENTMLHDFQSQTRFKSGTVGCE